MAIRPAWSCRTGSRVGRYELERPLGLGGMAEVWRARLRLPGGFERVVALKLVREDLACDPDFSAMLLEEARIGARLCHSGLVQTLDLGRHEGRPYVVLELVDGTDLRKLMRDLPVRRLPVDAALHVAAEVARALDVLHAGDGDPAPVLHRDICPGNVLISRRGEVKLSDFGIAHAADRRVCTRPGTMKGKRPYMAPEYVEGRALDERADLYGLGVLLARLVLGPAVVEPPNRGVSRTFVLRAAGDAGLTCALRALLAGLLARDPDARPATARAVARTCRLLLRSIHAGYDADDLAALVGGSQHQPTAAPPTAPSAPEDDCTEVDDLVSRIAS